MLGIKLKIRGKILSSILLMVLLSFGLISGLSLLNLHRAGQGSVNKIKSLGASAVSDSKKALIAMSREELHSLVRDQAYITNLQLQRVITSNKVVSGMFYHLLRYPDKPGEDNLRHFSAIQPNNPMQYSFYHLPPGTKLDNVKDKFKVLGQMYNAFKMTYSDVPFVECIYLGTPDGLFIGYPWMKVPKDYDPRKRNWYRAAIAGKGKITWIGPVITIDSTSLVMTCCKAVYNQQGKLQGVASVDVNVKDISQSFISTQLERKGYAFLVDSNGRILAREGMRQGHLNWLHPYHAESLYAEGEDDPEIIKLAKAMTSGKNGIIQCKPKGEEEQYIAYSTVPAANWSIGIAMPVSKIVEKAVQNERNINASTKKYTQFLTDNFRQKSLIYIGIGIGILIVITVIAIVLAKRLTDPILKLESGATHIGNGELDYQLKVETGDEIEQLAKNFNKMTVNLKLYIKNLRETVAAKEKIEGELQVASEIQMSMLPRMFPPFPDHREFEIFANMEPARQVGGDFYDFFFVDENKLFFCIGDVSGKGVPAALFMVRTQTLIRNEAREGHTPDEILLHVNNTLEVRNDSCMFATVFCGIMNTATGEVEYCCGGHNPPLVQRNDSGYEYMNLPGSIAVGPLPGDESLYKLLKLRLNPGEKIFLYTDGVTEANNPRHELYSEERLKKLLNSIPEKDPTDTIVAVRLDIIQYTENEPQFDDITMLGIRYKGNCVN